MQRTVRLDDWLDEKAEEARKKAEVEKYPAKITMQDWLAFLIESGLDSLENEDAE